MTGLGVETWLKILSFGLSIGAMIYAFFATRHKDVEGRFKNVDRRLDVQDKDIASLTQTVRELPSKDDIHNVQLETAKMSGKMDVLAEQINTQSEIMKRLDRTINRHEDHLLEGSKGK